MEIRSYGPADVDPVSSAPARRAVLQICNHGPVDVDPVSSASARRAALEIRSHGPVDVDPVTVTIGQPILVTKMHRNFPFTVRLPTYVWGELCGGAHDPTPGRSEERR